MPFALRKTLIALGVLVQGAVGAALADVTYTTAKDELEGKDSHYVFVRADDYKSITNENVLKISCRHDGYLFIHWHQGGRHSGRWDNGYHGVKYKFDDAAVETDNFDRLSQNQQALGRFVAKLAESDLLIMKESWEGVASYSGPSYRFALDGSLTAFSKFPRHCGIPL